MSATPMSFRLSPHTTAQLKALCAAMGMERQIVLSIALDRLAQAELREPEQQEKEREKPHHE